MGSHSTDSKMKNTAGAAATGNASTLQTNAAQDTGFGNAARSTLFGSVGSDGKLSGGTLSGFLDPNSTKVDQPTGTYGLQYNRFLGENAQNYQNARGALARTIASHGFGNVPNGFAADQSAQLARSQADSQGAAFTDYASKSYQDALSNFWKANTALGAAGDAAKSTGVQQSTAAQSAYNNLYGTAAQQVPSAAGQVIGGGLQAAGNVGAATVMCPVEGSMILMIDGTEKPVEQLRKDEMVQGIDGEPCFVIKTPEPQWADTVDVIAKDGTVGVSESHEFMLTHGGYQLALEVLNCQVEFKDIFTVITDVKVGARRKIYPIVLDGSHTYRVNGFWSLS